MRGRALVPVLACGLLVTACSGAGAAASGSGAAGAASTAPGSAIAEGSTSRPTTVAPAVTPSSRPSSSPPASSPSSKATTRTLNAVVPAAGVRQWLHCSGTGPVTLVVVTGLGAPASSWSAVRPQLERITRTCVYDRPGLGNSPARGEDDRVVDAGLHAHELLALLEAAQEDGPFVVVGHSYGGLVARAFVRDARSRVRGLLLAESVTPGDPTLGRYWTEAGHRVDMDASSAATGGGPRLGSLPLLVLSASHPEGDHLGGPSYGQPAWMVRLWRTEQAADRDLSSDAVQVTARSGHVLQQDDPDAVVLAVRVLVSAAEGGRHLSCAADWAAVHATCR